MIWDGFPNVAVNPLTLGLDNDRSYPVDPYAADNLYYKHARPSSRHGGIVIVSFCDGHQQQLRTDIDYQVFRHLMTPNGDEKSGAGLIGTFDEGLIRN